MPSFKQSTTGLFVPERGYINQFRRERQEEVMWDSCSRSEYFAPVVLCYSVVFRQICLTFDVFGRSGEMGSIRL